MRRSPVDGDPELIVPKKGEPKPEIHICIIDSQLVLAAFAGPMEFVIFGLTLLGVALFHRRALTVALAGLILTIFMRVIGAVIGALP